MLSYSSIIIGCSISLLVLSILVENTANAAAAPSPVAEPCEFLEAFYPKHHKPDKDSDEDPDKPKKPKDKSKEDPDPDDPPPKSKDPDDKPAPDEDPKSDDPDVKKKRAKLLSEFKDFLDSLRCHWFNMVDPILLIKVAESRWMLTASNQSLWNFMGNIGHVQQWDMIYYRK